MDNFSYCCPTNIVFGKGSMAKLSKLIPETSKVMLVYGQGSIKKNGVYEQVTKACKITCEFSGIEANPDYETCMKAAKLGKENNIDLILAVGGGSVVDGCKFIAVAMQWTKTADPWDMIMKFGQEGNEEFAPQSAVPLGVVLTLPATGTESNGNSVISYRKFNFKYAFGHGTVYPKFSILDPNVTFSLPPRQISNGIVDAFVHVMEQYTGHFQKGAVQDEQCEGLLRVLNTQGKDILEKGTYENRCDFFWATTQALNGVLGLGVDQCWATHMIGHELTAYYGLDHGQTLAIVLPELLRFLKEHRSKKLARMAERVYGVRNASDMAEEAIVLTEKWFHSLSVPTKLSAYGFDGKHIDAIAAKFATEPGTGKGVEGLITCDAVKKILHACL